MRTNRMLQWDVDFVLVETNWSTEIFSEQHQYIRKTNSHQKRNNLAN